MVREKVAAVTFWGSFSRPFPKLDFLMHFGRSLAPFWLHFGSLWGPFGSLLAPFWLPLAPFWRHLAPFWFPAAPFGYFWLHFGSLFRTLGVNFHVFLFNFLIFQISSDLLSARFLPELRKIDWKRNGFSISHLSHTCFLLLRFFFTSNSKKTRT